MKQFLKRSRLSRIYYDRKFFDYPLLKPVNDASCGSSGLYARCGLGATISRRKLAPIKPERSVEDWVVNRFGRVQVVRDFLQIVYRKGLGNADLHHFGRTGRPSGLKDLDLVQAVTSALFGPLSEKRQDPDHQDLD